jgi:hypothetical protein
MAKLIKFSCWIYCRLLIFYPRELRDRFSGEMVEIFEDLLWQAAPRGAAIGMAPVWRTALWELFSVGIVLRLWSTEVIAGVLSLIISSLIAWQFFRAVG